MLLNTLINPQFTAVTILNTLSWKVDDLLMEIHSKLESEKSESVEV